MIRPLGSLPACSEVHQQFGLGSMLPELLASCIMQATEKGMDAEQLWL